MPELPELWIYRERLEEALRDTRVRHARLHDPFVLRTVEPPLKELEGREVGRVDRRGKFLLIEFAEALTLAIHLMLAGRLHLKEARKFKPHRKRTVFSLEFDDGALLEMTEAGSRRRASIHLLEKPEEHERIGRGIEPFDETLTPQRLAELLRLKNRQLKKALRSPELLSGIGNAYSDEILFEAGLSPLRLTAHLADGEIEVLHRAIRITLREWIERIRETCPNGLPVRQRDWRKRMAVHGKVGEPCPRCGELIAEIALRDSQTNYCPGCQTQGRLLADRRMSRFGVRRPPRSKAS